VYVCENVPDTESRHHGRNLRDNALITLGLRLGMLRFSMCQLKFTDITRRDRMTFVKKGGDTHTIPLDDVSRTALRAWLDWLADHDVKAGFVFRSLGRQSVGGTVSIGDCLTPDGLYRTLQERARKANLTDLRPHAFRKTFLAWAKQVGAKPGQIAATTGHKSDSVGDDSGVTSPPAHMMLPPWSEKLKRSEGS
jgi:integrase